MTDKIDELAQEIRRVDGNNSLGAGALAEALMPFIARLSSIEGKEPAAWRYRPDNKAVWQYSEGSQPNSISGWLFEPLYASPAPPVEGTADKTPAVKLAEWAQEGPRLAKAAGCYVGIRITDARAALTAIGARDE